MELKLSFDTLELLYELYEFGPLDGRIQCIAELLQSGHAVVFTRKVSGVIEPYITLNNVHELEEFIKGHFRGWKPTEHYQYT